MPFISGAGEKKTEQNKTTKPLSYQVFEKTDRREERQKDELDEFAVTDNGPKVRERNRHTQKGSAHQVTSEHKSVSYHDPSLNCPEITDFILRGSTKFQ